MRLARFASFAASAALHIYFFAAAVGPTMSLVVGSFFAQGVLVVVESSLDPKRRSPIFGRAYVVASFVVTLPLFAEPALRAIGLGARTDAPSPPRRRGLASRLSERTAFPACP